MFKKTSQFVNRYWWRLCCHPVDAATNNAQLTDSCSVIDCKLSNPKVQSHAELASRPTPSHLFHFNLFPLSITSLTPTLPFFPSLF